MTVKFYDANKKWLWTVEGEIRDGKIIAQVPSRNARYFSCEVDGHALHPIPAYDPLKVEYGR
jgi:hypothetical protein